ncbi:hypothetical protein F750_6325 [Streptomyces sp. PAMC 26508]|nr:hypothetical protein F750_6325 [Streptomyces sp. PAMC 26508]
MCGRGVATGLGRNTGHTASSPGCRREADCRHRAGVLSPPPLQRLSDPRCSAPRRCARPIRGLRAGRP